MVNELKARGVNDILIAVVDGLKGFPEAITSVFPQTIVQTCIVHLIRNSLAFVSWKDRKAILPAIKAIYRAENADTALVRLSQMATACRLKKGRDDGGRLARASTLAKATGLPYPSHLVGGCRVDAERGPVCGESWWERWSWWGLQRPQRRPTRCAPGIPGARG